MLRETQEEDYGLFPQTILEGIVVSLGIVPAPVYREGCDPAKVYKGNYILTVHG